MTRGRLFSPARSGKESPIVKNKISSVIFALAFIIGLSLLLYPSVSDYWNRYHQTKMIVSYAEKVAGIDSDVKNQLLSAAQNYNARISERDNRYLLSEEDEKEYENLLNIGGNGIMGYIEIPSINCYLPLYHGTDESILQVAIGHIDWTSLPVGGESTHCVVSGHRGLPSAKLFSELDKLCEGDTFSIRVLDEVLTYEVDQILIVEPNDTVELQIVEGKDYFTLVTCTPYGVNSHRLLVRGHRTETEEEAKTVRLTSEAIQIEPLIVAPIVAAPLLILLMVWLIVNDNRKRKSSR